MRLGFDWWVVWPWMERYDRMFLQDVVICYVNRLVCNWYWPGPVFLGLEKMGFEDRADPQSLVISSCRLSLWNYNLKSLTQRIRCIVTCIEITSQRFPLYIYNPLTISTTKRVNTCLVPSSDSWRIQAKKWSRRALVYVVRGRALHFVAAFYLALENRKYIL